ncbi:uncharacterized protein [Miscanthus floridulus]|uniref:uncharacterized protein n=1 Tax=Miscanthus floridulus TaxID=154761 RepID=UPI0034590EE1
MWLKLLSTKDEALVYFKKVVAVAEVESGHWLKAFRTDCGGEFNSGAFVTFYSDHGMKHNTTTPYTPQQNGVVERRNQSVVEMVHCLLKAMKVPAKFWDLDSELDADSFSGALSPAASTSSIPPQGELGGSPPHTPLSSAASQPTHQTQWATPPSNASTGTNKASRRYRIVADLLDSIEEMDDVEYSGLCLVAASEPGSIEEAMTKDCWRKAMKVEMQAIEENKTWDVRMLNCNPSATPMESRLKLYKRMEDEVVRPIEYRSIIGSLRYIVNTRPDLAFSVGVVSWFMEAPSQAH